MLALSDLWEGLEQEGIDPSAQGLRIANNYQGGYGRISAGTGADARLVVEWNESSRHLRVLRCEEWPRFETLISRTVSHVREIAHARGISETVDRAFVRAIQEDLPCRRTVITTRKKLAAR
jgi:hypothetical protein